MAKERICREAFEKGYPNFKGTFFWGTNNSNLEMAYNHIRKGKEFVFIDMPYFDTTRVHFTGDIKKSYFRVTFNYPQMNKIYQVPSDRFSDLEITIKPWRKTGSKILILGSSRLVNNYYGGGRWIAKMKQTLTTQTKKYVTHREKLSSKWIITAPPLMDDLKDCAATVSLTSLASVRSIVEGIPVFCHPDSCCAPVGQPYLNMRIHVEKPNRPNNRIEWANSLAYGQFTLKEISKGLPLQHYNDYFS